MHSYYNIIDYASYAPLYILEDLVKGSVGLEQPKILHFLHSSFPR